MALISSRCQDQWVFKMQAVVLHLTCKRGTWVHSYQGFIIRIWYWADNTSWIFPVATQGTAANKSYWPKKIFSPIDCNTKIIVCTMVLIGQNRSREFQRQGGKWHYWNCSVGQLMLKASVLDEWLHSNEWATILDVGQLPTRTACRWRRCSSPRSSSLWRSRRCVSPSDASPGGRWLSGCLWEILKKIKKKHTTDYGFWRRLTAEVPADDIRDNAIGPHPLRSGGGGPPATTKGPPTAGCNTGRHSWFLWPPSEVSEGRVNLPRSVWLAGPSVLRLNMHRSSSSRAMSPQKAAGRRMRNLSRDHSENEHGTSVTPHLRKGNNVCVWTHCTSPSEKISDCFLSSPVKLGKNALI